MALGLIKEPTDTVVTCLASTLDDVDQRIRNFSAIGLGSIGQAAKKAVPDLIRVCPGSINSRISINTTWNPIWRVIDVFTTTTVI